MSRAWRVGLDLDGTVVLYDAALHRWAVERFGMPAEVPVRKGAVRAYFFGRKGGAQRWIELQGFVYGTRLSEAVPALGVHRFLRACSTHGIEVRVVSHKTEYPVIGPRVSLRNAAREWLAEHDFFREALLRPEHVFFEPTREGKLGRIASESCTAFVDDLEDVFAEPTFPRGVARWLYAPGREVGIEKRMHVFASWDAITSHLLTNLNVERGPG